MEGSVRNYFAFLGCITLWLAPVALAESRHSSGGFSNSGASLPSEPVLKYPDAPDANVPQEPLRMPASRGATSVKPATRGAMTTAPKASEASVADLGRQIEQEEDDTRKTVKASSAAPSFQAPKLTVIIPPVSILPSFATSASSTLSGGTPAAVNFASFISGSSKDAGAGEKLNLGLVSAPFAGTDSLGKLKFDAGFKLSAGGSSSSGSSSTPSNGSTSSSSSK